MSSGYQEPAGGTASPSTGTAVGSKPIRAWLKVLRNVDVTAEPDFGSNFIPRIKTPFEILSTALRIQNPAQTFYTNLESAALIANQSIKIPIITATESGAKKDEVVLLKQAQSLEGKTFPTFFDVIETAAPANPATGVKRIYVNSTTHELTQRSSTGAEVKMSDGSGGGGGGAPTNVPYLTLASDGTLTVERVLTASGRVSITDAGANSTATLDIVAGSIVDSQIGSHTSTKITITAKGQLPSDTVYTGDTQTLTGKTLLDTGSGNVIGIHTPYSFTIYQNATNYFHRNNWTGAITSFANTDLSPVIDSAIAAIAALGSGNDTVYGGSICIQKGAYIAITQLDLTFENAARHGIDIFGEGEGSHIRFQPGSALTDAIKINIEGYGISNCKFSVNANVTNIIHAIGVHTVSPATGRRTDYGRITNNMFVGNIGFYTNSAPTAGQTAIYLDGTNAGIYWNKILFNDFGGFAVNIKLDGGQTTSCLCLGNTSINSEKHIVVSGGSGQHTIAHEWVQGDTNVGVSAVELSGSGKRTSIAHITTELHKTGASCQAILIGSGVQYTEIGRGITNVYDPTGGQDFVTIRDNSGNVDNHYDRRYRAGGKHFLDFEPGSPDLIKINSAARLNLFSGQARIYDAGFDHYYNLKTSAVDNGADVDVTMPGTSGTLIHTVTDAVVSSHTSTKITITNKSQLNSSILYSDVDNALGSHYVDITERAAPSNPGAGVLRIYANSTTHELTQRDSSGTEKKFSDGSGGSGAPTNATYLVLSGDATLTSERTATASTRVTITDAGANSTATFDIGSGSITDTYIGSHTSTKISITAKGQLNSAIVYNDQANTFGANNQTIPIANLLLSNNGNTGAFGVQASLTGTRVWSMPNSSTNIVGHDTTDTFTNKSYSATGTGNSLTNVGDASIASHTSTKITITTKGQLNSNILYGDQNNSFGAFYHDITEIAAPASPGAGVLRIWADSTTHELSQKNSSGTVVKLSDGSGGGGITASSTDTLTNKTINPTTNILPYLTSFSYSIYQDGGAVKARNNKTGAIASNANLDPLITTILASGDPSFEVQPGTYNLASGFTGWSGVGGMDVRMHMGTKIYVPQGYAGQVWNFTPNAVDMANIKMNGGWYSEQGTQANNWSLIYIAPTGTGGGVHSNTFRDIYVEKCNAAVWIHTDGDSWANSNTFSDWFANGVKYGVFADHANTYTVAASGHNANRFVNFDVQAYAAGGGRPNAIKGFYISAGQYNVFENCIAWDFHTATGTPRSAHFDTNADSTIIQGGLMANHNFLDQGTNTTRIDGLNGIVTSRPITIVKTAQSGSEEQMFSMSVAGASGDSFTLQNAFDTTNTFNPLFRATITSAAQTASSNALYFQGVIATADNGASTEPVIVFGAKTEANVAIDNDRPIAGFLTPFTAKMLFYPNRLDMTGNSIVNAVIGSTVTGIVDANISSHTSTKITITAKGQLNSNIVYTDQANTMGDFDTKFRSARLMIRDTANDHDIIFAAEGDNAANRTIFIPVMAGNDFVTMANQAQTITQKTVLASDNNFSGFAQNSLNKRWGTVQPGYGSTATSVVALDGMAQQFGVTAGGTNSVSYDTTEGKVWVWQTANSTGVIAGLTQNSAGGGFGRRLFGGRMKVRFKIDSTTSARFYFGLTSATSTPISETILANGDSGMLVGFRAADTNFFVFTHAGSGSMTATQLNAGGAVAKTVTSAFHTLELKWTAAGNLDVIYDGTTHTISTDLPATSTDLYPFLQVQTSAAVQRTFTVKGLYMEADK